MTPLHKGNSTIDRNSGAIIFTGSPELQAICELQKTVKTLNTKLDTIIEILSKGGVNNGGEVENTGFSPNNDSEI